MLRIILTVLAIWIASNLLFVLLVIPPRTTMRHDARENDQRNEREGGPPGSWQSILSAGRGAFFSLAPVFARAMDSVRRLLSKHGQ